MTIDIKTRDMELDPRVADYVNKKIGSLEKFVPRDAREVTLVQVILQEDANGREGNRQVCEAVVTLPKAKLVYKEGTVNIYAAIDIVEAKLKNQLREYKDKNSPRQSRVRAVLQWRERRRADRNREES